MPSVSGSLIKESPRLMGVINLTTDSFSDGGKFDVIENDSVIHLFKITHLDNSTAVYDNDGNLVMKSTINKPNNNNGEKNG